MRGYFIFLLILGFAATVYSKRPTDSSESDTEADRGHHRGRLGWFGRPGQGEREDPRAAFRKKMEEMREKFGRKNNQGEGGKQGGLEETLKKLTESIQQLAKLQNKETPAESKEAPAETKEAQAATKEAPAATKEAPAATKESQAATKEAPAETKEAPAASK